MNNVEFLLGIKAVLSSPEKWTKGRLAKDVTGEKGKKVDSPDAACWCVVGAGKKIAQSYPTGEEGTWLGSLLKLPELYPFIPETDSYYRQVVLFNDDPATTYDMVIDALDRAITRETAKLNAPIAQRSADAMPE